MDIFSKQLMDMMNENDKLKVNKMTMGEKIFYLENEVEAQRETIKEKNETIIDLRKSNKRQKFDLDQQMRELIQYKLRRCEAKNK